MKTIKAKQNYQKKAKHKNTHHCLVMSKTKGLTNKGHRVLPVNADRGEVALGLQQNHLLIVFDQTAVDVDLDCFELHLVRIAVLANVQSCLDRC